MAPPACEREAVMEVYGLCMCEVHGEEAAAGALEEIAYDLEQELGRPTNGYVRPLSPHLERGLEANHPEKDGTIWGLMSWEAQQYLRDPVEDLSE